MRAKSSLQTELFEVDDSFYEPNGALLASEVEFTKVLSLPAFSLISPGEMFELSLRNDTRTMTHGLHRFPAKFIPQIPRWAIREFGKEGCCILDPFMGSGTTLVEGLVRKGETIGVDIDPLAKLITKAKTNPPSSVRLAALGEEIRRRWTGRVDQLVSPMPDVVNFDHWFSLDAWAKLQSLLDTIQAITDEPRERTFLLVVFSSIIRWVSNADDQTQKTYVSGTNRKSPPDVTETFWRYFEKAFQSIKQLEGVRNVDATIGVKDVGDASALALEPNSVDLVITSPPYLDSVDYKYNLMLEYFWLGPLIGVPSRRSLNELRRKVIGAKNPIGPTANLHPVLQDLIQMDEMPDLRREATVAYFNDMATHFQEAARCMKVGARYVLIIGNSQTAKGIVPLHDCLVRLASSVRLQVEKAFAYRVRRHYMKFPRKGRGGIILIDWVIVLRKVDHVCDLPARLPLKWITLGDQDVAH